MKKISTLLILFVCAMSAWAYDVAINDIYYNLDKNAKTAAVTFQETVSMIPSSDYMGDIVIPEKITVEGTDYAVTGIGYGAFLGCNAVLSISMPASIKTIDYAAFEGCSRITSIDIPENVTKIGQGAFEKCKKLTEIVIPNKVQVIERGAFYDCTALTSVTLPASLQKMDNLLFCNCTSLTTINCLAAAVPTTHEEAFKDLDQSKVTIYVPETSVNAFKSAAIWSAFADVKPLNPAGIVEHETASATPLLIFDASAVSHKTMQRGMNIVKMSDGTVRKVMVK